MATERFTVRQHVLPSNDLSTVLESDKSTGHVAPLSGTKVVMSVGPASHAVDVMVDLMQSGAVGARVDLTWGSLDFHKQSLRNLQVAMQKARKLCAVMVDTLGRELMIRRQIQLDESGWLVHEESFVVKAGQQITVTTRLDAVASSTVMPITYDRFTEMAEPGDTIYVGRYLVCGADSASLYLDVKEVKGQDVICVAKNDAVLEGLLTVFHTERSTDALLNVQNALPLLSDYDKEAISNLSREFEIDYISLSYTRNEDDVHEARAWLSSIGCVGTLVLAKIETRQSLLNFEGILSAADGIIISRGNLGLDCVPEKMAMIQKTLVQASNLAGKPVLITRVCDTMVDMPRPTRAEATDVANAVLDGVDGILLGAETLRGKFPSIAVRTISDICRSAEKVFDFDSHYDFLMQNALDDEDERSMEARGAGPLELDAWGAVKGSSQAPIALAHGLAGAPSLAIGGDATITSGLLQASPNVSKADITLEEKKPKKKMGAAPGMPKVHTAQTMLSTSFSSSTNMAGSHMRIHKSYGPWRSPFLSKLESIASSAVRVADKVRAGMMICYTQSGATAALVAKYRPPMPILTLVVPTLNTNGLSWQLQGRTHARQCLLVRGLVPVLANPSATGEDGLNEAIEYAATLGLVKPLDHIVCVHRTHDDTCIKVLTVDLDGMRVKRLERLSEVYRTKTLIEAAGIPTLMSPRASAATAQNSATAFGAPAQQNGPIKAT